LTQNLTPTDSDLLNKLIEFKAFDDSDAEWIRSQTTTTGQAEQLIAILTRKPNSAFDKFIEALEELVIGLYLMNLPRKQ
jgi:hypothetical protein